MAAKKSTTKALVKKTAAKKAPAAKTAPVVKKAATKKAPVAKKATVVKKAAAKKAPAATSPAAPRASKVPRIGSVAPAFSTVDHTGRPVSSASLRGKPYVLYFYPKDDTPGCTREACGFRDLGAEFAARGAAIFGVSPDSAKSHQAFASKYQLPFSLLIDEDKKLADAYGAWALKKNYGREYLGIVRSTFLIDASGKIAHAWPNVKVDGHVEAVLSRLGALA